MPVESKIEWNENRLMIIDSDEHDFQEFKSSPYLQTENGISSLFTESMSKQVSAFANGGGGRILIGINDYGKIDGGVRTDLKGGGTRSWLEDVIPDLVYPKLQEFNVYEIVPSSQLSQISAGCAVYLIEIPSSTIAPHQARDKRYYLRIAGKSRPMHHLNVMDIMRRTSTPNISLSRFAPYGQPYLDNSDKRGPCLLMAFKLHIVNQSRKMAKHVGIEISVPRPLINRAVRLKNLEIPDLKYTQRPGDILFFHYHTNPIFPGQERFGAMIWIGLHPNNLSSLSNTTQLTWRIYADDAEALVGYVDLMSYNAVQKAIRYLSEQH